MAQCPSMQALVWGSGFSPFSPHPDLEVGRASSPVVGVRSRGRGLRGPGDKPALLTAKGAGPSCLARASLWGGLPPPAPTLPHWPPSIRSSCASEQECGLLPAQPLAAAPHEARGLSLGLGVGERGHTVPPVCPSSLVRLSRKVCACGPRPRRTERTRSVLVNGGGECASRAREAAGLGHAPAAAPSQSPS